MVRRVKVVLVVLVLAAVVSALCGSVSAQPMAAQQRLLAKRAALVDAYRNLAERVKGLQIDSQTYVRDFVAESDIINTQLDTFIKGARITDIRYYDDGTCEVDIEATIEQIIATLKRITREHYQGGRWHEHVFEKIRTRTERKVISASGSGAPREAEPQELLPAAPEPVRLGSPTTATTGWENVTPRGRLMAQRAARVDALRNLAETVKGLQIDSQTYVRDFVAESDIINTQLDTFIKGARFGEYRYLPDGAVEVDAEVTIQQLIAQLKRIYREHYHGGRWHEHTFEKIRTRTERKVISATGSGVPPERYTGSTRKGAYQQPVQHEPEWADQTIRAKGYGVPPAQADIPAQARLMAERAAEIDAKRNLAERVNGVRIDARTTVRDFVTENDEVNSAVQALLRGAERVDTRYLDDGSVEVEVELPLRNLWEIVTEYR